MIAPTQVVLLDLGNTLFYDNVAAWPKVYRRAEGALWRALRSCGVRAEPAAVYRGPGTFLGYYYALRGSGLREPGAFHVLRELMLPHAPGITDAALTSALHTMYRVTQSNWRLERDAAHLLKALKQRGFRLGAVSNGSDDWNALELIRRARLRDHFELVLTSAAHGLRKPDPSIFRAALDHFRVEAKLAVMIGDSYEADILGAGALGMRTIWITRRVASTGTPLTVTPDAILETLREVPAVLG
jgi:HAD superfamily hydrolase (TIGR01662 family)